MKQWDVTIKRIGVVTVQDIIEKGERLAIPMSLEVLAAAKRAVENDHPKFALNGPPQSVPAPLTAAPRRHPLGKFS
jgi:hypothetical protein